MSQSPQLVHSTNPSLVWVDDPILQRPYSAVQSPVLGPCEGPYLGSSQDSTGRSSQRDRARTPSAQASPAKRVRPDSPLPSTSQSVSISQVPYPSTPAGPSRSRSAVTPSSGFTPSQKQRRLESIQAGLNSSQPSAGSNLSQKHSSRLTDIEAGLISVRSPSGKSSSQRSASRFANIEAGLVAAQSQSRARPDEFDSPRSPLQKRSRLWDYEAAPEPPSPVIPMHDAVVQTDQADDEEFFMSSPHGTSTSVYETAHSTPYSLPEVLPEVHQAPQTPGRSSASQTGSHPSVNIQSGMMTPPRSSQNEPSLGPASSLHGILHQPESPTRSKSKGKTRDLGTPASQWQRIQADLVRYLTSCVISEI